MPQCPIVFNDRICKGSETVHKEKVNNVQKFTLAHIHNVQYALAEDHQLDQVKFSYTFA